MVSVKLCTDPNKKHKIIVEKVSNSIEYDFGFFFPLFCYSFFVRMRSTHFILCSRSIRRDYEFDIVPFIDLQRQI